MGSQVLIYSNDQSVGPIAPYARLEIQTEAPNAVKLWKTRTQQQSPCLHGPSSYYNEGTKLYCLWNTDHLLESTMGPSAGMSRYCMPLRGEELLSLAGPCHPNAVGTMETGYI